MDKSDILEELINRMKAIIDDFDLTEDEILEKIDEDLSEILNLLEKHHINIIHLETYVNEEFDKIKSKVKDVLKDRRTRINKQAIDIITGIQKKIENGINPDEETEIIESYYGERRIDNIQSDDQKDVTSILTIVESFIMLVRKKIIRIYDVYKPGSEKVAEFENDIKNLKDNRLHLDEESISEILSEERARIIEQLKQEYNETIAKLLNRRSSDKKGFRERLDAGISLEEQAVYVIRRKKTSNVDQVLQQPEITENENDSILE